MSTSPSMPSTVVTRRRRYPLEYKRQVVHESFAPGASIAGVALAHGINANLLHNWRWQYRRGDFGPLTSAPTFLAVQIAPDQASSAMNPGRPAKIIDERGEAQPGNIELVFDRARVVIHGAADQATLRCVIEALSA